MLEELKKEVYEANMQLPKYGLCYFYLGERKWNRQGKRAFCD